MRIEHKVKALQKTKAIFNELKTDPKSVLFSKDELDTKLLKKLKKITVRQGQAIAEADRLA